jgi:hypothetical protein
MMTGAEETERVINECASLLLLASPNPEPRPPTPHFARLDNRAVGAAH